MSDHTMGVAITRRDVITRAGRLVTGYVRVRGSLIEQVFTAQDAWRHLTPAQRRALLTPHERMHPVVRRNLRYRQLLRQNGTRSRWGDIVVQFSADLRPDKTRAGGEQA